MGGRGNRRCASRARGEAIGGCAGGVTSRKKILPSTTSFKWYLDLLYLPFAEVALAAGGRSGGRTLARAAEATGRAGARGAGGGGGAHSNSMCKQSSMPTSILIAELESGSSWKLNTRNVSSCTMLLLYCRAMLIRRKYLRKRRRG